MYGSDRQSFEIEDRVLAHLRLAFMNKLRRGEPFFFHVQESAGLRSLWVHPAVPIVFHFTGSRQPPINREWVEKLIREAGGPHGLSILPEPQSSRPGASEPVTV